MAELSFDTSFLIDFQRERRHSNREGPAHRFLEDHADATLAVTTIALGEFMEGFEDPSHPVLDLVVAGHEILSVDLEAARIYGQIARFLRASGTLIGTNDLWIAAVTRRHGLPLVTSNEAHFRRVPDLAVRGYR
jgi:tRNA(fMet)-specific endonuclease VapC